MSVRTQDQHAADPALAAPHVAGLNIGSGLTGPWRRVWRSPLYRLSIILVAFVMALLPMVYFGLIGLMGYGIYWYAVHSAGMLKHAHGVGAARGMIVVYLAPILMGLGLIGFMLKPMLAPRRRGGGASVIHRAEEPVLYAFVEMVCRIIRAPAPKQIKIDCDINASAGFRGGMLSLLRRGDLVLTVGMPLVSGLTLNQFAGVLAHEFGHFSQGAAMRAYYLTYSINHWFARMVYSRDAWDWQLEQYAATGDSIFWRLVCALMRLGIWLTRRVLKVFLFAAHAISAFMSRQMEFDADRHQARFVGAEVFAATAQRISELEVATRAAMDEIRNHWKAKQLPDDAAALVADASKRVPASERERIARDLKDSKAGVFDTHPSLAARIRRVRKVEEAGIFNLEAPASVLFRHFQSACRRTTYAHYQGMIGGGVALATLVPTGELLRANARADDQREQAAAYLGLDAPDWRPLFLAIADLEPPDDPAKVLATLKQARARLAVTPGNARGSADQFRRADDTLVMCDAADAMFAVGVTVAPKSLGLAQGTRLGVSEARSKAIDEMARASDVIDPVLAAAAVRVVSALRILHAKGAEQRFNNIQKLRDRSRELAKAQAGLRDVLPYVRELRSQVASAHCLATLLNSSKENPAALDAVRKLSDKVRDRLDDVRRTAGAAMWPYDTPSGRISVGARLVTSTPGWRQMGEIFDAAKTVVDRYPGDAKRIAAELADLARTFEEALKQRAKTEISK